MGLKAKAAPAPPPSSNLATAMLALTAWAAASSALVVVNKRVMVDAGFRYPLALTGAGQLVSAGLAWVVAGSGLAGAKARLGAPPATWADAARLAPVVLCSAGSLFFGNAAYLTLSVAFIQILKVLMPAATLAVAAAAGMERVTPRLAAAVTLICAGAAVATGEEVSRAQHGGQTLTRFAWTGLASFLFSVVLEAGRVVWMQRLLAGGSRSATQKGRPQPSVRPYSSLEVCAFLGPPTGVVLLLASAVLEWRAGLGTEGLAAAAAHPARLACALAMGFAVNAATAAAIAATSSLTFKVVGTAKNAGVVALGVVLEGDTVSAAQVGGYALSTLGFWLYVRAKAGEKTSTSGKVEVERPVSGDGGIKAVRRRRVVAVAVDGR